MAVYLIIDFTVKLVARFKGQYCVYNLYVGDVHLWELYPALSSASELWLSDELLNHVCFVLICIRFLGILISGVPRKEQKYTLWLIADEM